MKSHSWKKVKAKMAVCKALAPELSEAKKRAVKLRGQCREDTDLDLSDDAVALSVIQKDYYGDHSLIYMCENLAVSAARLDQLLSIEGAEELAHQRRAHGDYPLHYLCSNPNVSAELVFTFLKWCPDAAKWRGKWGAIPLHVLCCNRNASASAIRVMIKAFPGGVDYQDTNKAYPIHLLCAQLQDMSTLLREFLKLSPHAGFEHVDAVGHRALDILARNHFSTVECFESLLECCPQALDSFRVDIARGLACPYLSRVKATLELMDERRGQKQKQRKRAHRPTRGKNQGPDQHVNAPQKLSVPPIEWIGDKKITRQPKLPAIHQIAASPNHHYKKPVALPYLAPPSGPTKKKRIHR